MIEISASGLSQYVPNRRRSQRRAALLPARIAFDSGTDSIECTIRDISEAGARVQITADDAIPDHGFLIVMRDGTAHEAEVRWRKPTEMGLALSRPVSLRGAVPKAMQHVKDLWTNQCVTPLVSPPITITAEMIDAGVAAYSAWKPLDLPSFHSEPDMIRSVYAAMQRVRPKDR